MRFTQTFAVSLILGSFALGANSASATPVVPLKGMVIGNTVELVRHRPNHHGRYGSGSTTKAERMMRRRNTMQYGNPNARNPERPGYQQQLGNTTNGPRY